MAAEGNVEISRGNGRVAVIVQQGKVLDYIDGTTQRPETPEEYVRQEIAKSLVREYGYGKAEISVEFTLRLGTPGPRADLVIFDEGEAHEQDRARIIVECKSRKSKPSGRKDGVGQLQSYMAACPNAGYGMWTNGIERFCYRRVDAGGKVRFEEVADVPSKGKSEDDAERPRFDQLKAASSDALLFAFRRCHNYIAGNQGLQKPEAFWELLKIIFCKIHDERSDEIQFYATSKERHGLNGPLKAKRRLDQLFDQVKAEFVTIFRENDAIELDPGVLAYLVSQMQMYSLLESDIDVKGRAYEEIVGSNLRGDRGEFFTPRNVCKMAVAMLDPGDRQLILDPACGTGGFLITAMNYVIEKIRRAEASKGERGQGRKGDPATGAARSRGLHRRHGPQPESGQGVEDEHGHEQRRCRGVVPGELPEGSGDVGGRAAGPGSVRARRPAVHEPPVRVEDPDRRSGRSRGVRPGARLAVRRRRGQVDAHRGGAVVATAGDPVHRALREVPEAGDGALRDGAPRRNPRVPGAGLRAGVDTAEHEDSGEHRPAPGHVPAACQRADERARHGAQDGRGESRSRWPPGDWATTRCSWRSRTTWDTTSGGTSSTCATGKATRSSRKPTRR